MSHSRLVEPAYLPLRSYIEHCQEQVTRALTWHSDLEVSILSSLGDAEDTSSTSAPPSSPLASSVSGSVTVNVASSHPLASSGSTSSPSASVSVGPGSSGVGSVSSGLSSPSVARDVEQKPERSEGSAAYLLEEDSDEPQSPLLREDKEKGEEPGNEQNNFHLSRHYLSP
eukprot:TRINITY_DN62071_c0_g2_i1.p1 TRINITY_DN62071_c0_g2~~TRINITY_DN62071_c0_g2_i1.p1  ORF type:complete len:170 (-),score=0.22 TRINITY_DN62071_c0_g2_i1:284-793(-)